MVWQQKFRDKNRLKLLIIILLLNFLSFGLGFVAGSKIFNPNPIIINGNFE